MIDQAFIRDLQQLRDNLLTILNVTVDGMIRQLNETKHQEPIEFSLTMPSSFFKGKKPTAVVFPDGRNIAVSNWKQVVSAIFDDAIKDDTSWNSFIGCAIVFMAGAVYCWETLLP